MRDDDGYSDKYLEKDLADGPNIDDYDYAGAVDDDDDITDYNGSNDDITD